MSDSERPETAAFGSSRRSSSISATSSPAFAVARSQAEARLKELETTGGDGELVSPERVSVRSSTRTPASTVGSKPRGARDTADARPRAILRQQTQGGRNDDRQRRRRHASRSSARSTRSGATPPEHTRAVAEYLDRRFEQMMRAGNVVEAQQGRDPRRAADHRRAVRGARSRRRSWPTSMKRLSSEIRPLLPPAKRSRLRATSRRWRFLPFAYAA